MNRMSQMSRMSRMSRMNKALMIFAALGAVAWFTLDEVPLGMGPVRISLRTATLVILGLFAFRTWLHGYRLRLEAAAQADASIKEAVGRE